MFDFKKDLESLGPIVDSELYENLPILIDGEVIVSEHLTIIRYTLNFNLLIFWLVNLFVLFIQCNVSKLRKTFCL